ncbi:TetR/AcrR family transcriptional regulator [Curtobacterium sp. MCPF17_002]|uniref:TetR/AcrR family transcriptional regulator n=1 Tax=Curtobacterium sp. MCPF17_002 TaxID=2175645 RepID=UPI000DA7A745|nr:TetR/AcrR family transcriptional regulator [Curtobacterium sp. MCPF17_002]WIB78699.1 TetR/AcrR family transcriptional regulator [Curtobacterium sp. MCPF17_002]
MPRQRSDEKRTALLESAARVISRQGLASAATSAIAKDAGVSTGSLFVYFESKTVLLNALYVALRSEMGAAAAATLPTQEPVRAQIHLMWTQWLAWAVAHPDKRRALAQLEVAEEISPESHLWVDPTQRVMADLVEQARADGPLAATPLSFVMALTSAIADTTMDALIRDPAGGEERADAAFDAVWRVLAG